MARPELPHLAQKQSGSRSWETAHRGEQDRGIRSGNRFYREKLHRVHPKIKWVARKPAAYVILPASP